MTVLICRNYSNASRVHAVLEDVLERVLTNMHRIQKNLQFWQSIAQVFFSSFFGFFTYFGFKYVVKKIYEMKPNIVTY